MRSIGTSSALARNETRRNGILEIEIVGARFQTQNRKRARAHFMIVNNYSPKWRRIVVDIYRAAKRQGKYPPLSPTLR